MTKTEVPMQTKTYVPVLADFFRPSEKTSSFLYDAILVAGFSILIALSAQLSVLLPFSPVPVTGQTFAVVLTGMLLGSSRGFAAVLAYLAEGALGMPVFAGGTAGPGVLAGPTGGYLLGFLLSAWLCGFLSERGGSRTFLKTVLTATAGSIVMYAAGLPVLAIYIPPAEVLSAGVYPFIFPDIVKIILSAVIFPSAWKWAGRHNRF